MEISVRINQSEYMTKKEYKECLAAEVFVSKSSSILRKLLYRFTDLYLNPSHHAIFMIRKMQYLASRGGVISRYRAMWIQKRLVQKYSMHVSPYCKIGKGFHLPHPVGIVIGSSVSLGFNVSVYQNCTLGGARIGDVKKGNQPTVGNNVTIFAGSLVLGRVTVADNVIIAANSVLLKDAEECGIYAGTPAKLIMK